MKNYTESCFKSNLAQLPLFYFGKGKPKKTDATWFEKGKFRLQCFNEEGVPGSFDLDCYTAVICMWIRQGKPVEVKLSYSDLARELGLDPKNWVSHLKKSLMRLSSTRYELSRSFIEAGSSFRIREKKISFSFFDSISLFQYRRGMSKKSGKSYITLSNEIQSSLNMDYYESLDLGKYRMLPEGLPRRLYEYLYNIRKSNCSVDISEERICRVLPIRDQNTTARKNRIKRISGELTKIGYLSDCEYSNKSFKFTYSDKVKFSADDISKAWQESDVNDYIELSKKLTCVV